MKIIKVEHYTEDKRVSIDGFNQKAFLVNGVLIFDAEDYQKLQDLVLEVYYS